MKKTLVIGLSLSLLLLSGCNEGSRPVQPPVQQPVQTPVTPAAPQPEKVEEKKPEVSTLPKGTFVDKDYDLYGTTYVKGYATTEVVDESFCETDCKKYTYVMFHILENNDPVFEKFLEGNNGNSFAGTGVVGLGCENAGIISYKNHSDKFKEKEVTLSSSVSQKILASKKTAPITLKLTREKFLGGGGAPACYSHMTYVELS